MVGWYWSDATQLLSHSLGTMWLTERAKWLMRSAPVLLLPYSGPPTQCGVHIAVWIYSILLICYEPHITLCTVCSTLIQPFDIVCTSLRHWTKKLGFREKGVWALLWKSGSSVPPPCLQGCTKSHPVPVSFGGVRGQRGGQVGSAWRRWTCKQKSWWTRM